MPSGASPDARTRPACIPRRWCQAQSVMRLSRPLSPPRERKTTMIVEVPARRADGNGAMPPVAREDGVAVARLPFPFRLHVPEECLEPAGKRIAGMREGEHRGPEERHDGGGSGENDLRVQVLPLGARTHLPRRDR